MDRRDTDNKMGITGEERHHTNGRKNMGKN
jgi:hypothetical protein